MGRGRSSRGEGNISADFAGEDASEDAELEFERAAVADFIVEERMGDEVVHALFVGIEKLAATRRRKIDGITSANEITEGDHAVVDGSQDGGFGDERTKFLHNVEGEGGAAKPGLMIEADIGIKADGVGGKGAVFGKEAVSEGEKGVDGIGGRASIAMSEVEGEHIGFGSWRRLDTFEVILVGISFDHALEISKIERGGGTFDAEEFGQRTSAEAIFSGTLETSQDFRRRLSMITHEHSAVVANFSLDKRAGKLQANIGHSGLAKLFDAEEDIFEGVATGDTIEPSTHGKIGYRNFQFAEGLDGLRGDLDIAEEGDMTDVGKAKFVENLLFFAHLEDLAAASDMQARGV